MTDSKTPITFADLLRWLNERQPNQDIYKFVSGDDEVTINGQDLFQKAQAAAFALQKRGMKGERVILSAPQKVEFVIAFYACILSGAIAVPIPQPRHNRDNPRYTAVVLDAKPKLTIAETDLHETLAKLTAEAASPPELSTIDWLIAEGTELDEELPEITEDMPALIQYTSGSTGDPKGAIITQGNLIANSDLITKTVKLTGESCVVSWLPFFHDMGLSAGVLMPVYTARTAWLLTPASFLKTPMSWLEKLSETRSTVAVAPNFAFELLCERATPEALANLDLSSISVFMSGSEPVSSVTMQKFGKIFQAAKLDPNVLMPVYGLAEYTLMVSGRWANDNGPTYLELDDEHLLDGKARPADEKTKNTRHLTSNGAAEGRAAIVDPNTFLKLPDGDLGEIWLTGPSLSPGYWNKPDVTSAVFGQRIKDAPNDGPYYRTGDLGFLLDDQIYVTGRIKDVIIVRGRNHFPADLVESATRHIDMVATAGAAAFGYDFGKGEEVILLAELTREGQKACSDSDVADRVIGQIREAISEQHQLSMAEILLIKPMRIPRTTSGKIQHQAAKNSWIAGELDNITVQKWAQPRNVATDSPMTMMTTRDEVETWLVTQIAALSGVPTHDIALDDPFSTYGMDSLAAVRLVSDLDDRTPPEMKIDATDLYDYPTIESLLDHYFSPTLDAKETESDSAKEEESDLSAEMAALSKLLD